MNEFIVYDFSKYEAQMNEALRDVALEIRAVALLDLASYIHSEKFENIADIFDSAIELYFKPGTLRFSYSGEVKLDWFGIPLITLDLELHASGVDIFFKLNIETLSTNVHFCHAMFDGVPLKTVEHDSAFSKALNNAIIPNDAAQLDFAPISYPLWNSC